MRKVWLVPALAGIPLAYAAALAYDAIIQKHAANRGFDPLFVHAVIQQESHHNPRICSGAGACGLMQLMPATARGLGITEQQRFDPDKNVGAGTLFLRQLHTQFGNTPDALRAYNWGPGNMRKYLRRVRNGQRATMPRETNEYVSRIAWYYYDYGGKGNMFAGIQPISPRGKPQNNGNRAGSATANPNRAQTEEMLRGTGQTCPKPQLPEQPSMDEKVPEMSLPAPVGGSGKVVIDPAKVAQWTQMAIEARKQLETLKGQYNTLTKGMAGLNLLKNVATISGYEVPNIYGNQNMTLEWGKAFDGNLYRQLLEMKAADTGVYANGQLKGNVYADVQAINHSYAESEVAWAKLNCAVSNLEVLVTAAGRTQSVKQARDVQNAIDLENTLMVANQAKIRANILAMQSRYQSLKITAEQAYTQYLNGKGNGSNGNRSKP